MHASIACLLLYEDDCGSLDSQGPRAYRQEPSWVIAQQLGQHDGLNVSLYLVRVLFCAACPEGIQLK
jgi:hypothetical protein